MTRAFFTALLALSFPAFASADVVGPDPTDCPLGSRGASCHGMEYCAPQTCTTSATCGAGEICQSRDLCMSSGSCGGLMGPDAAPPPPVPFVTATCSGTCAEGTCETVLVCVPDGTPPGTGGAGCGCRVSGPGTPLLGLGALGLIGLFFVARRRR